MRKNIVPDSNVFSKLVCIEHDTPQAKEFFKRCLRENHRLIVPELFKYEIASVSQKKQTDLMKTLDMYEAQVDTIMTVASPSRNVWETAQKIIKTGHQKSGYPSIYDSVYHGLAIELDATYLTSDKKHFAKAKDFNHICLLENWEMIFDNNND